MVCILQLYEKSLKKKTQSTSSSSSSSSSNSSRSNSSRNPALCFMIVYIISYIISYTSRDKLRHFKFYHKTDKSSQSSDVLHLFGEIIKLTSFPCTTYPHFIGCSSTYRLLFPCYSSSSLFRQSTNIHTPTPTQRSEAKKQLETKF